MDFLAHQLFDGRQFRLPRLVEDLSRERLAIQVSQRLTGVDVVGVLQAIASERGAPKSIRVINGRSTSRFKVARLGGLLRPREARLQ